VGGSARQVYAQHLGCRRQATRFLLGMLPPNPAVKRRPGSPEVCHEASFVRAIELTPWLRKEGMLCQAILERGL
ncbi:hypothetical protein, partial [Methylacidimicrobium cyclopophantes]|uniref:hypothetical protein n=1 Tax=Methylacidimicrobium cyclopophantes TaxID=1041766 RepID=UPI001C49AC6B